jgi:L-amino acid N-acyltransferase YncA
MDDGSPVGAGFTALEPQRRARGAARAGIYVPVEERCRGAGSALLRALADWAAAERTTILEGYVREDDEASFAWAAHRGFSEAGRESRLALDLRTIGGRRRPATGGSRR